MLAQNGVDIRNHLGSLIKRLYPMLIDFPVGARASESSPDESIKQLLL
jgi:hypothetical protein